MGRKLSESELRELLGTGFRYACALRIDAHDAEDLVQEAWIKVVRAYGEHPSTALLLRSIRNLHIDQYRRTTRVNFVSLDTDDQRLFDEASERAVTDIGDPALNAALAKLREEEREVLFLTVVEGYTANEVSKLTNKPRGTVLSLAHRARMKMQTYLMEEPVVLDATNSFERSRS